MEIVQERLRREFGLDIISTAPGVVYKLKLKNGEEKDLDNPPPPILQLSPSPPSTAPFPLHRRQTGRRQSLIVPFSTAMKADCGTFTWPNSFILALPRFCFSSTFILRVTSPP